MLNRLLENYNKDFMGRTNLRILLICSLNCKSTYKKLKSLQMILEKHFVAKFWVLCYKNLSLSPKLLRAKSEPSFDSICERPKVTETHNLGQNAGEPPLSRKTRLYLVLSLTWYVINVSINRVEPKEQNVDFAFLNKQNLLV